MLSIARLCSLKITFFNLKSDLPKININSTQLFFYGIFIRKSQFYGPLKLKIENRLPKEPRYFVKKFVHV